MSQTSFVAITALGSRSGQQCGSFLRGCFSLYQSWLMSRLGRESICIASQGFYQPGFPDAVSDGVLHQDVADPDQGDQQDQADRQLEEGNPGELGLYGVGVHGRNHAAWLSIADFLSRQNLRAVLADRAARSAASGKRSDAAAQGAALASTLPHGNHGENKK
ncbi:MAG: hypothetical protein WBF97_10330 [Comamonas sp.]